MLLLISGISQENYDYRNSELLLYQNQILIESGNYEKALEHLTKFSAQIFDKLSLKEAMGDLHIKLGQQSLAVPIYEQLIKRNPENVLYYAKYFEAKGITDNGSKLAEYKKFQVSAAFRRSYSHLLLATLIQIIE